MLLPILISGEAWIKNAETFIVEDAS